MILWPLLTPGHLCPRAIISLFTDKSLENNWDGRGWIITGVRIDDIFCWGDGEKDGGGGKGKDFNDPDCIALRESGVTKAQFDQLKKEWHAMQMDRYRTGAEQGSLWIRSPNSPGGMRPVDMVPFWRDNGMPGMKFPNNWYLDPGEELEGMSHMHWDSYRPFGKPYARSKPTNPGISSKADRERVNEYRVPSYIGFWAGLFVYRPKARGDELLMGSNWWEKDCF
jgi:hypothetical protein